MTRWWSSQTKATLVDGGDGGVADGGDDADEDDDDASDASVGDAPSDISG